MIFDNVITKDTDLVGTINEGYKIYHQHAIDQNTGIVSARNGKMFVTWEYSHVYKDEDVSFYWGHYFDTWKEADCDYFKRIAEHYYRWADYIKQAVIPWD